MLSAALFCSFRRASPMLAGGRAGRNALPCWGEGCCAQGKEVPGAGTAVGNGAMRPGRLPALPQLAVLLLHSWSYESSAPGEL